MPAQGIERECLSAAFPLFLALLIFTSKEGKSRQALADSPSCSKYNEKVVILCFQPPQEEKREKCKPANWAEVNE